MDGLSETISGLLDTIQSDMLEKARKHRDENTYDVESLEDFKEKMEQKPGFAKAMWCGERECEEHIKSETSATIRCMPFNQEDLGDKCHFCGKEAKHMVYVAKAY